MHRADVVRVTAALAVLTGLAAAWRWTPLGGALERLGELAMLVRGHPLAPLLVVLAYVVGGLMVVPLSVLMVLTVAAFGPWPGAGYTLVGALASAAVLYGVGRALGRGTVERLLAGRARRVAERVAGRGVLAVAVLRNLPVAPYSVVNLALGASPVGFGSMVLGTALGLVPAVAALALLGESVTRALRHPSVGAIALVLLVVAAVAVTAALVGRHLLDREETR
jgi:phospholipase D1/2